MTEKKIKKRERERIKLEALCKPAPQVSQILQFRNVWGSYSQGQRWRRWRERLERQQAVKRLGSMDTLAHLISAMAWHPYYPYIVVIATHPNVTSREFEQVYGLIHSNYRVVASRLSADLASVGWRVTLHPVHAQNEPWGWRLEQLAL
ncbi:MAG: hypothetical protein WBH20_08495 [Oceanisphaera sp.]|uniref:hypothetical protein n=1 Tax=Oceanisphaera sp. TaxID=1929979 RepID=UPI003C760D88